jgi:hypothetical protein
MKEKKLANAFGSSQCLGGPHFSFGESHAGIDSSSTFQLDYLIKAPSYCLYSWAAEESAHYGSGSWLDVSLKSLSLSTGQRQDF